MVGLEGETEILIEKWEEAKLNSTLLSNIMRAKYTVPRKIQSRTIPLILDGRCILARVVKASNPYVLKDTT